MLRFAVIGEKCSARACRYPACTGRHFSSSWRNRHPQKKETTPTSDLASIFQRRLENGRKSQQQPTTPSPQQRKAPAQNVSERMRQSLGQRPIPTSSPPSHQIRQVNETKPSSMKQRMQKTLQESKTSSTMLQSLGQRPIPTSSTPARQVKQMNETKPSSMKQRMQQTLQESKNSPNTRPSFQQALQATRQAVAAESSSNSQQRAQQPRNGVSIREMLQRPPTTDMRDVSNLRAAFLNGAAAKQSPQQRQGWRQSGATEYRKSLQQYEREKKRKEDYERRMRAAIRRKRAGVNMMSQAEYLQAKQQEEEKKTAQQQQQQQEDDKTVRLPPREATIAELSALFRVKMEKLTSMLREMGERPSGDEHLVDLDVMELLAMELGLEPIRSSRRRQPKDDKHVLMQRRASAEESEEAAEENKYESLPPRPPVVCIMGHVDHGKTTLMDALRQRSRGSSTSAPKKKKKGKTNKSAASKSKEAVAGTEAGGITQVISAFQVPLENKDSAITFLDTPGHAAFRAMRESGSNAADVIVLVVAADDGVSPQTVEILNFYKSIVKGAGGGGISMVVAMSKIDKHGIDIDESRMRIENQLLEHGILSETFATSGEESEYGPPVQLIPVSGLTGQGLDDLIEGLMLQSEVMDLRADENAQAEGIVMDARMEKGVGVVADCIVRWGSLERGNVVVSGVHSGKVKTLKDVNDGTIKKGLPSQPVRIYGFKSLPKAGDPIVCVASEEVADQIIERRKALQEADSTSRTSTVEGAEMQITGTAAKRGSSLEEARTKYGGDTVNGADSQIRIPVIIRADGEGSLSALQESVLGVGKSSSLDVIIDIVSAGIGAISASDVRMAKESGASVLSFGVKQNDKAALAMAEAEDVEILSHDVIYSLLDDAKKLFAAHLPEVPVEVVHGKAKVQAVFDVNNKKNAERIAGLAVLDGTLYKGMAKDEDGSSVHCMYRVTRNGVVVSPEGEGLKASSLRKVKEDVDDVRRGEECGLGLADYTDFEKGDIIECYSVEMKREFI